MIVNIKGMDIREVQDMAIEGDIIVLHGVQYEFVEIAECEQKDEWIRCDCHGTFHLILKTECDTKEIIKPYPVHPWARRHITEHDNKMHYYKCLSFDNDTCMADFLMRDVFIEDFEFMI